MALSLDEKLDAFKSLLEYFVSHLEWEVNRDPTHIGYACYIRPLLERNCYCSTGQGQQGDAIQQQIEPWAHILDDAGFVGINIRPDQFTSRYCFLNCVRTWVNIKGIWAPNAQARPAHITALFITHAPSVSAVPDLTMSLPDLGLFDGRLPNDNLKRFLIEFLTRYENYAQGSTSAASGGGAPHSPEPRQDSGGYQGSASYQSYDARPNGTSYQGSAPRPGSEQRPSSASYQGGAPRPGSEQRPGSTSYQGGAPRSDSTSYHGTEARPSREPRLYKASDSGNKPGSVGTSYPNEPHQVESTPGGNSLVADLVALLQRHKNLLLTGVSGTGKTYLAQQVAGVLVGHGGKPDQIEQIAFHPSYDYADLVEGLRPSGAGFAWVPGSFKSFCGRALDQPDLPFVFIIDDFNQGDVRTILGEVVRLIDPGCRGVEHRIKTQYHNVLAKSYQDAWANQDQAMLGAFKFADGFFVPHNVFLIATMNEFEGRAEPLDSAVWRRFVCYELKPQERLSLLKEANLVLYAQDQEAEDKLVAAHFYDQAAARCTRLNQAICAEPSLGTDYQLGPAFLLKALCYLNLAEEISEESVADALNQVWDLHLAPMLRTYLRGKSSGELTKLLLKLRNAYRHSHKRYYDQDY